MVALVPGGHLLAQLREVVGIGAGPEDRRGEGLECGRILDHLPDSYVESREEVLEVGEGGPAVDPIRLSLDRDLTGVAGREVHPERSRPQGAGRHEPDRESVGIERVRQIAESSEAVRQEGHAA